MVLDIRFSLFVNLRVDFGAWEEASPAHVLRKLSTGLNHCGNALAMMHMLHLLHMKVLGFSAKALELRTAETSEPKGQYRIQRHERLRRTSSL